MKTHGTILVSDRNKGLLTALVLFLQKEFSNVIAETEPENIVGIAKREPLDIIVLDTGQNAIAQQQAYLKLIGEIVALGQNIQIIVLTNFGQNGFAMECINSGAFDFITKPWNNEKLLVTVKNAYRIKEYAGTLKEVGMLNSDLLEKEYRKMGRKAITLEQMEVKMMQAALKRNKGNISLAAAELGITRQTMYNKGKKHNLFK